MINLSKTFQFFPILLLAMSAAVCQASPLTSLASDDQRFLALRDAASKEDVGRAAELASQLSGYAIPSYVDYYLLKSHLRTASESEIRDFLARNANTAIADRLRNDWLILLGHQNNWASFDAEYPQFVLNDDTQVKCFALLSKLKQGQNVAESARNLLTSWNRASSVARICGARYAGLPRRQRLASPFSWRGWSIWRQLPKRWTNLPTNSKRNWPDLWANRRRHIKRH